MAEKFKDMAHENNPRSFKNNQSCVGLSEIKWVVSQFENQLKITQNIKLLKGIYYDSEDIRRP